MKSMCLKMSAVALITLAGTGVASGAVLTVTEVFTHNEKDNFTGNPSDMINGSGMNSNAATGGPLPNDITLWSPTSNAYQAEWQSGDLLKAQTPAEDFNASGVKVGDAVNPGTNGKIGWAIFDLGAEYALDDLYIWHIRESNTRWAKNFNVLVATSPTAAPVHGPTNNASRDYDFSSGGWTTVATGLVGSFQGSQVVDLTGFTGRYLAFEIIQNNGDADRVGFAEIGITGGPVPEPGSLALVALGGLMIGSRRRRKG